MGSWIKTDFMESKENMGKGSIGETTGREVSFPWIARRRLRPFLPVFGDETLEQLPNGFTMDFVAR